MSIDLSPLYRNTVGYDRLAHLLDATFRSDNVSPTYPPYNIEVVDENHYGITIAVAGFAKDEIDIQTERGVLTVSGKKAESDEQKNYLHKGIAFRSFVRKFNLAEHVEVQNASLQDGLLTISLERQIPEQLKPKRIEISSSRPVLEGQQQEQSETQTEQRKISAV